MAPVHRSLSPQDPPVAAADIIPAKGIIPQSDAFIRSDGANKNYGTHDSLLIQKVGNKGAARILVAFPQSGIADSLGADSLVSASLELTIKRTGTDWGSTGRAVAVHRMTQAWTEAGATWNCANDLNLGNSKADCTGNTWTMAGATLPFAATAVAQSIITNGRSGVVSFDVTSDVRAFLANPASNQGWLLKLAAEAQTGTVVFQSKESATKPRLVLSIASRNDVPEEAPSTLPAWVYAPTNLDSNTVALPGAFLKNIVIVEFKPSATLAQRQAAVASVNGTVVGGVPSSAGEGHYYLSVPDTTRGGGLVSAVRQLGSLPQVQLATYEFAVEPMWRQPKDDANWSSWHTDRKTLNTQRWAMEAVLGPMAWGCSTGDPSVKVALVDLGFPSLPVGHDLAITIHPPPVGINPSAGEHGIGVASVLAARGDNQKGMTGMMWQADLHGWDVGEIAGQQHAFVGRALQQIKNAADDDARIVNVALAVLPHWHDSTRALAGRGLDSTLSALGARGKRQLIVLAAGNFSLPADTAGFPRAVNGRNGGQVMVVAASTKDSALMVRSGGFGSNHGPLITVAAPGADVFRLRQSGAIEPWDGTSTAAPIVSGIAGLLLSFDTTLQAADLKSLIVDGANAGGWKATRTAGGEQYSIVNAYESLKLAARRPGAPLCGNRVWSQEGTIYAQRGGTNDPLFSAGGPAGFLNVFHGGRRIDWMDDSYEVVHSAVLTGTTWAEVADRAGLTDTAPGGTYRSLGTLENDFWYSANHDNDSLIRTQNFPNVAANDVKVQTSADNGATWTQLLDFQEPGHDGTTTEYLWRRAKFATDGGTFTGWTNIDSVGAGPFRGTRVDIRYYPDGSKALLTTQVYQNTHTMLSDFERCPWASEVNGVNTEECRTVRHEAEDYETRLAELSLETGARRPLMTLPGFAVASAGVSEAGDEMMLVRQRGRSSYERVPRTDSIPGYTFINTQVSHDQCQASWHSLKDPSATPFQIMAPSMCTSVSSDGGGTIAPVRMKVSASPADISGAPGRPLAQGNTGQDRR